jgi:hypothetical protein
MCKTGSYNDGRARADGRHSVGAALYGQTFSQGATRGSLTGDTSGAWSGTMLTVSAHLHISALRFDSAIL